jgi:hypothetical protein
VICQLGVTDLAPGEMHRFMLRGGEIATIRVKRAACTAAECSYGDVVP